MRSLRPTPHRRVLSGSLTVLAVLTLLSCSRGNDEAPHADAAKTPSAAEVAQQHVDVAKRLMGEKKFAQAVDEFTAALDAVRRDDDPMQQVNDASLDANVLRQRGSAYLAMGFPDTAAADLTEVLRLRPDDGAAYAQRGQAYVQLGDLYKAVRDCTEAIRYEPENAAAYRWRGEAYLLRGQFDRAVADLDHATTIDAGIDGEVRPLLAKAYLNLSRQLARSEEPGTAADAAAKLAKARELDPALVAAAETPAPPAGDDDAVERTVAKQVVDQGQERFDAGLEHFQAQRYDEALADFTAAIDARPDFAEAYLRRGQTLMALGFADTAVKDFEQAIHYGGETVEALRLQADAYLQLGSPHRAALSATDALHADPLDAASYVLRGIAYVELAQWDRAIGDLEQAVRLDASRADAVQPILERAYRLRDASRAADDSRAPTVG